MGGLSGDVGWQIANQFWMDTFEKAAAAKQINAAILAERRRCAEVIAALDPPRTYPDGEEAEHDEWRAGARAAFRYASHAVFFK